MNTETRATALIGVFFLSNDPFFFEIKIFVSGTSLTTLECKGLKKLFNLHILYLLRLFMVATLPSSLKTIRNIYCLALNRICV